MKKQIESLRQGLENRSSSGKFGSSELKIGAGINETSRFTLEFPGKVKEFYQELNGFEIPGEFPVVFYPIESLHIKDQILIFAKLGNESFGYDFGDRNPADEWNVVHIDSGKVVTMTLGSFLNRMWRWLDIGKRFWIE